MSYKLTIGQRACLPLLWIMWALIPSRARKTWHEVKKGMERHEHRYTVPAAHGLMRCEHEGCTECHDPAIDAFVKHEREEVERVIARSRAYTERLYLYDGEIKP